MVHRGIAERAHHDGVGWQLVADPQPPCAGQGEGHPDRLGQVGGDGRGLRRHPERAAAPHLVPSLGNGVLAGCDDSEQCVEGRGAARQLPGPGHHESARAVVEEGRVGDPQLGAEDRVVLVAGTADGVEAAVGLLQPPSGHVQLAAGDLVLEQLDRPSGGQGRARAQRRVRLHAGNGRQAAEESVQGILDHGDPVEGHAPPMIAPGCPRSGDQPGKPPPVVARVCVDIGPPPRVAGGRRTDG